MNTTTKIEVPTIWMGMYQLAIRVEPVSLNEALHNMNTSTKLAYNPETGEVAAISRGANVQGWETISMLHRADGSVISAPEAYSAQILLRVGCATDGRIAAQWMKLGHEAIERAGLDPQWIAALDTALTGRRQGNLVARIVQLVEFHAELFVE